MSRVLHPTRHIIGHFRDESFQAITCAGTDNSKQTRENTPKTQKVTLSTISIYNKLKIQNTQNPLVSKSTSERGMTKGWLPEIAGAGSLGLNGGGDTAAVPPRQQQRKNNHHNGRSASLSAGRP